jgi:hypothetical protein
MGGRRKTRSLGARRRHLAQSEISIARTTTLLAAKSALFQPKMDLYEIEQPIVVAHF